MKNLEVRTCLLLVVKGLIQLLKITVSFIIPLLIAAYFYALMTAFCNIIFTPDLSLNSANLGVLIMSLFTVIPEIIAVIVGVIGIAIYMAVKFMSAGIQSVLSSLLLTVDNQLKNEYIDGSILDSKKVKYAVVCIAEIIAFVLLYSFFAKYNFNMNYFCYAIGGSSTFGTLIDLNEQFRMVSFYLTAMVALVTSFGYIHKNYIMQYPGCLYGNK